MEKKKHKKLWLWVAAAGLLLCILVFAGRGVKNGRTLSDMPGAETLESVVVYFPQKDATNVLTDREDISLAVSLNQFLKYIPLAGAGKNSQATVEITYVLTDGTSAALSVNAEAVQWKGKWYRLKNRETFVRLAEAYFFPEEIHTLSGETEQESGETEFTLSDEAVDWLIWFQSLSDEEKQAVSFIPEEIRELLDAGTAGETEPNTPHETDSE